MKRPTSYAELVAYLHDHPVVEADSRLLFLDRERRTFRRADAGGFWFTRPDGTEAFLPVDCGLVPELTNLTFHDDRFSTTKFGVKITFYYIEGDAS